LESGASSKLWAETEKRRDSRRRSQTFCDGARRACEGFLIVDSKREGRVNDTGDGEQNNEEAHVVFIVGRRRLFV